MKRCAIFSGSFWDLMIDLMERNDWVGEESVEKKWEGLVWVLRFESLETRMRRVILRFRVLFMAMELQTCRDEMSF